MPWFVDNPRVVAAGRQNIGHFGVDQQMYLECGTPRSDVIAFRADGKYGYPDVTERDRTSVGGKPPFGEPHWRAGNDR